MWRPPRSDDAEDAYEADHRDNARAADDSSAGCCGITVIPAIGALVAGIIVLGVLLSATNPDRWEPIASPAEHPLSFALSFATDPRHPETIYLGTEQGDILISQDGAQSWVTRRAGLPPAPVSALLSLPNDTGLVASSGAGVYVSTDGGATFQGKGSGIPRDDIVDALVATPDGSLLAGTAYHGVYRLPSGQAQWQQASAGLPDHADIYSLLALPQQPEHLLAGLVAGSVYASRDGGVTWTQSASGLPSPDAINVFSLLAVPPSGAKASAPVILAGTSNGIYRSGDGGSSWSASSAGLGTTRVLSLFADPITPTVIVAGTDTGVAQSTDGGASWHAIGSGLPAGEHIGMVGVVHPAGGDQVLLASAEQLYRYPGAGFLSTQPWRAFAVVVLLLLVLALVALVFWLLRAAEIL